MSGIPDTPSQSLCEVSNGSHQVELNGKTYTIKRLRMSDFSAAQDYIKDRRIKKVMAATAGLSEEMRSAALARVVCTEIDMIGIWNEFDGEVMMLQRGITVEGKPVPLQFILNLEPEDRSLLRKIALYISGLGDPFSEGEAETDRSVTHSDSPSNGEKSLPDSAVTTVTHPEPSLT